MVIGKKKYFNYILLNPGEPPNGPTGILPLEDEVEFIIQE